VSFVAARTPLLLALRRCLQVACWPTVAAALGAFAAAFLLAPELGDAELGDTDLGNTDLGNHVAVAGAMTPWLHLPLLVLAGCCAAAAVVLWPLFAARAPGADWLVRLQRGPLHGCGAVVAGALLAQLLLLKPLLPALARGLGAPAGARAHLELQPPLQPLLNEQQRHLAFAVPAGTVAIELHLRPLAALPAGAWRRSRITVRADGELLTTAEIAFAETGEFRRVVFAPRAIAHLELELLDGTVPLFFPPGSTTLVGAHEFDTLWNGLFAALLSLLPTFVALGFACLCGTVAALPTVLAVTGVLLFVQTIGGAGPLEPALRHLLRGHWLPATGVFRACLPSLAVGSLAMIAAMLLRRRLRR